MAIFAKKKDGRRERDKSPQTTQDSDESGGAEPVTARAAAGGDAAASDGVAPESSKPREGEPGLDGAKDQANGGTTASTAVAAAPEPRPAKPAAVATADAQEDGAATGPAEPLEPVDIEPEEVPPVPAFGIADAIRLMRSLPADPNVDLVVRVVRVTLGALNVSVDDILQDAERKEQRVRDSVAALETEVSELEKQLQAKRAAIAAHQADLRETATVRERLRLADKYTPHPPPLPPDAARAHLPKPREWDSHDTDSPFGDSPFKIS